ncbi:MAG TPA: asparaginase [Casimicrobiaceae bacterium]|nr:asparaginase [Casimicrobiaceae bacterium]
MTRRDSMQYPQPRVPAHVPLVVTTRGDDVESVHHGSIAVVDRNGRIVLSAGDPDSLTFTRSALKPLQALPFVRDGGPQRFGYSEAQIALLCASHSGEPRHVDAVADMLVRADNRVADLQCGSHAPGFYEARAELPPPPPYSPLAHNCSGKHAGMLALCTLHGHDKRDYLEYEHPVQRVIRSAVADMAGVDEQLLHCGIDGCSAPNYAMPLASLAFAFARLAVGHDAAGSSSAVVALRDAMRAHPGMVSGEKRSDEALMRAGRADWVAKIGAEGVQALGVTSRGVGIAVKIADGGRRALLPAVVATLEALELVDDAAHAILGHWNRPALHNVRGTVTGTAYAVARL